MAREQLKQHMQKLAEDDSFVAAVEARIRKAQLKRRKVAIAYSSFWVLWTVVFGVFDFATNQPIFGAAMLVILVFWVYWLFRDIDRYNDAKKGRL